jgi:hypothetical protein
MFRIACLLTTAATVLLPQPTLANNCDSIRAGIESRIRAAGVSEFALTVVDAGAAAPGQIVGRCAQGSKQIMYVRGGGTGAGIGAAASDAAAVQKKTAALPRAKGGPDIVECRDGSTPVNGRCPR